MPKESSSPQNPLLIVDTMKKSNQLGSSISSSDLIDAKLEEHQMCGSKQCPGCGHKFEGKPDWLGLPAGVKFDPTDQELIEHLEAKVEEAKDMKSHPLIDEFITPIEGEDGICYTHPEKLPGVTRDGLSKHFFHRPSKAYTTGTRKRRKIQTECDLQGGETRWHKTGKTRPVMVNGKQKGCKKILVLYTNFGKNRKPEKTNWVMHQYHLGQFEEEKEGELVVSKIFYQTQPRQCNWTDRSGIDPNTNRTDTNASANTSNASPIKAVNTLKDQDSLSNRSIVASMSGFSSSMDIQSLKNDQFNFNPSFDHEVHVGEVSARRDGLASGTKNKPEILHEQAQQQQHHMTHHEHLHQSLQNNPNHISYQQQISTTAYHINMPSPPISTIISPPPLHHNSIDILNHDSYHVSTIMLQNESYQHQQQQHHKIGGRSASSGLEELIMGCTSSNVDHVKEESSASMTTPQEADWLKYSTYWPDPDNPDHHQG